MRDAFLLNGYDSSVSFKNGGKGDEDPIASVNRNTAV